MNTEFKTLQIDKTRQDILLVTLNRPEVRNAINSAMMGDLRTLWHGIYVNTEGIKCVIVTGSGEKAFCAGADLKERNTIDIETWQQHHAILEQAMIAMVRCPIPIIAAVNGVAFGGGLELVLASDFAYASDNATFALPETKIGLMPGAMGTQNLPQACGIRRAKEICFSGASFSAEQALQWGIINKICTPTDVLPETVSIAESICENAPLAIQQAKKSLNASQHALNSGYIYEIEAYNHLVPTNDRKEGIRAFNEKRKPNFTGS